MSDGQPQPPPNPATAEGLFESLADGVVGLDSHGRITYLNPAAATQLGYRHPQDGRGASLHHHIPGPGSASQSPLTWADCPLLQAVTAGEPLSARGEQLFTTDGRALTAEIHAHPTRDGTGNSTGAVVLFRVLPENSADPAPDLIRRAWERAREYFEIARVMMVVLDRRGCVAAINQRGCEVLGLDRRDIEGRDWFAHFLPAEIRGEMRPVFDSLMRGELERSEYWENEVLTGDGERRLIAFRNGYLQDEAGGIEAILSSGIDITDQRRTEQALRSQEQWLHSLLEAIPTPVFYKDTEGRYLGCNSAFAEFLGLSPAEITGRTVFDLAPPELAETYHAADQALFREGGTQEYESSVIGAAGLRRDVLFHKSVFYREDGELGGLIGVAMDITERKEMEAALRRSNTELERMANHDRLTGAYNRRQFDDFLLQEVQRAERHGTPLALIMLDIDHFKWVNDAYGHLAGDEILQQLVSRVGGRLRTSDLLARWGGEEFMVLLPETDEAGALTLAEDLRRTVEDAPVAGPGTITISLGVAEHRHGQHLKDLTKRVDDALYAAKAGGRNRVATA